MCKHGASHCCHHHHHQKPQRKVIKVAIDGPSASGKSSTARTIASHLGFTYIDSGAIYRCVTLAALENGWISGAGESSTLNLKPLVEATSKMQIQMKIPAHSLQTSVWISGREVTNEIRSSQVNQWVSFVAKHGEVRDAAGRIQRELISSPGSTGGIIMDGRDIGSVVMPDACVKIFMLASAHVRAQRRFEEQQREGGTQSFEQVLASIQARDAEDEQREHSPLVKPADAVEMDTTKMNFSEQVAWIEHLIHKQASIKTCC